MSEKLISEKLKKIILCSYELDRNKLEITHVDSASITIKDFEELTTILPSSYKLNLADNKIIIMPVSAQTENLILLLKSTYSAKITVDLLEYSETCYNLPLPNPTVQDPDAFIFLTTKWNALSVNDQNEAFPSFAPNFVVKIYSNNDLRIIITEK
ncbi:6103_t:CDS:2 [Funneliformis caledonium]|uniref:6103_t:CDS:1 n=1 Tax=Funneliformis caledonium TaxID=1117310 RepID=A0A9N9FP44_9GLOM|nr:6103_t:CDS:2 [Funneliformis caledonium]